MVTINTLETLRLDINYIFVYVSAGTFPISIIFY